MANISDSQFQQQVQQVTTQGAFNLTDANVDDGELGALLKELEVEPTNDDERAGKFFLYEKYADTLGDTRKAALDLWKEARDKFPEAPQAAIEHAITNIDRRDAMGLHFSDNKRRWFVYDMTTQAHRNSGQLEALLEEIKRKLGLLIEEEGEEQECPICLGILGEGISGDGSTGDDTVTTLSCCHKMCTECWTNWERVNHGRAFCPLCREGDFDNVVETGGPGHVVAAPAFTFSTAAPAPSFGGFAAPMFGAAAAPNLFGAVAAPAAGFSFGAAAPAATPAAGFSFGATA
jgi:hypothetical protein